MRYIAQNNKGEIIKFESWDGKVTACNKELKKFMLQPISNILGWLTNNGYRWSVYESL